MVEPLFTVRDFRTELSDEVADAGELLRNYEFNISQGIVQRVSRFFDALALMDERGEVPPARGEGDKYADSARGGVMGFGRKRNVCNQEKQPARRVAWEQQEKERIQKAAEEAAAAAARKAAEQDVEMAALKAQVAAAAAREVAGQDAEIIALKMEAAAAAARKAAEQDTKMAALEAKVAEMQALAAPSAPNLTRPTASHTLRIIPPDAPYVHPTPSEPSSTQFVPSPPPHHLRPPQELAAPKGWFSW